MLVMLVVIAIGIAFFLWLLREQRPLQSEAALALTPVQTDQVVTTPGSENIAPPKIRRKLITTQQVDQPPPAPAKAIQPPTISSPPVTPVSLPEGELAGVVAVPAGAIVGKVVLKGRPPPEIAIAMSSPCEELQNVAPTTHRYVVSHRGELADTVIYLKTVPPMNPRPTPEQSLLLEFSDCRLMPYVFGIQSGQVLWVTNTDPTLHDLHIMPRSNSEKNVSLLPDSPAIRYIFQEPEMFARIKCDIHNWEFSYACVFDNPYFAISGTNGDFAITNVPPGTYTIFAAHLRARSVSNRVTLSPGQVAKVNFILVAK